MMWLLIGCGEAVLPPMASPPVDLTASVQASKVPEGEPVVLTLSLYAAQDWTLQLQEPAAEGLELTPAEQDGPVQEGDRQRTRLQYNLTGPAGSYVIQPGAALAVGPGDQQRELVPPPIFVDIGVDGPTGGELAGAEAPPEPPEPPWALIGAGVLGVVLLSGGLVWWMRRPKPIPPPEPIDVRARRLWSVARSAGMDDHTLALTLSGVLRDYLQRRYSWPATSRTSREILAFLEDRVPASLRLQLTAVLEANDRLKYAREGGGGAFFDSLEASFLDILQTSRPAEPTEAPAEPAAEPAVEEVQ